MSHFGSIGRWGALAALGLGVRLWAQAPAAAPAGGWQTSAQVMQGFDTNVLLSATNPQGAANTQYQFSLGRNWVGPRSSISVSFSPQGAVYASHSALNYVAESYEQSWTYAWQHSTLTWLSSVQHMPERASQSLGIGGGAAGAAAGSLSLALATVLTSGTSSLSFTHQYSPRSSWSASGTVGLQVFSQDVQLLASLAPGNPLTLQAADSRSHSAGAGVSWSHKLTERRSVALSANASPMWYSNPARTLLYSSLQASVQQQLGAGMMLSVGGGPAWNRSLDTAAGIGALPGTSYTANAGLTMQRGRTQYGVTWDRSEQASMVPGGVTTQLLGLQYSVRWGSSWSASASAGYSQYAAVTGAAGAGQGGTYLAGQINYRIATDWSLQTGFNFNSQFLPTAGGGSVPLRRAHVSFGLSYQSGGSR